MNERKGKPTLDVPPQPPKGVLSVYEVAAPTQEDVERLRAQAEAKTPLYEEAMRNLNGLGLRLNNGVTLEQVVGSSADHLELMLKSGISVLQFASKGSPQQSSKSSESLQKDAALDLLFNLGSEDYDHQSGESRLYSNDVAFIDFERIENKGDYVGLMARMATLVEEKIHIRPLEDEVRFAEGIFNRGKAWLRFSVENEERLWKFKVDNDWVDPTFFARFDQLIFEKSPEERLFSFNDGQSDLFFVASHDTAKQIAELVDAELRDWRAYWRDQ